MRPVELRAWLARLMLAIVIGIVVGGLVYLGVRAVSMAYLISQEQAFFQEAAGLVRGGLEGVAGSNLREERLRVEARAARYNQLSLISGLLAGGLGAAALFLYLERAARSATLLLARGGGEGQRS